MPKFITPAILEAVLDKIADSTRLTICSASPSSVAEINEFSLAQTVLEPSDFAKSDFSEEVTVYDEAGNPEVITLEGRKLTIGAKENISITSAGESAFTVLDDGDDFLITPCDQQLLVVGGKINLPAFDIKQRNPE